jgi:hypothetical protein
MVENAMEYYGVSEQKACRVLGQCRATQRYEPKYIDDEELLRSCVIDLAGKYGRYGYKRVTALLNQDGWKVNHKRFFRIRIEEGLNVHAKQRRFFIALYEKLPYLGYH